MEYREEEMDSIEERNADFLAEAIVEMINNIKKVNPFVRNINNEDIIMNLPDETWIRSMEEMWEYGLDKIDAGDFYTSIAEDIEDTIRIITGDKQLRFVNWTEAFNEDN